MRSTLFALLFLGFSLTLLGKEYHHVLSEIEKCKTTCEWEVTTDEPFDNLIISWNGLRPISGTYSLYVRIFVDQWSPWVLYAKWGTKEQNAFCTLHPGAPFRVFQDVVELFDGKKSSRFQVRVEGEAGASLKHFFSMHVGASTKTSLEMDTFVRQQPSLSLPLKGMSQLSMNFVHNTRISCPVATTVVINFLKKKGSLDPLPFCHNVQDCRFGNFANAGFNTAQAFVELGHEWMCWAERLEGFQPVYERVQKGLPVILAVRGLLPRGSDTSIKDHALVVVGYDSISHEVACMDPVLYKTKDAYTYYPLTTFLSAWDRCGNLAFLFEKANR